MSGCSTFLLVAYRSIRRTEKYPLNARLRVNAAKKFNILFQEESPMRQLVVSRVTAIGVKHIHTRVEWSKWDRYAEGSSELPHSQTELKIMCKYSPESETYLHTATVGLFSEVIARYDHECQEPFQFLSVIPQFKSLNLLSQLIDRAKTNKSEELGFGVVPGFYILHQGTSTRYYLSCLGKELNVEVPSLEKKTAFDVAFKRYSLTEGETFGTIAEGFFSDWEEEIYESICDLVTRAKNGALLLGSEMSYHPNALNLLSRKMMIYLDLLLEFLLWFDERILQGPVSEWCDQKTTELETKIQDLKKPKSPAAEKKDMQDEKESSWETDEEDGEEEFGSEEMDEDLESSEDGQDNSKDETKKEIAKIMLQLRYIQLIKDLRQIAQSCQSIKTAAHIDVEEISRTLVKLYTLTHDREHFENLWTGSMIPKPLLGKALVATAQIGSQITIHSPATMAEEWDNIPNLGNLAAGYLNQKMASTHQITRKLFTMRLEDTTSVLTIKDDAKDKDVHLAFTVGKQWLGEFNEQGILLRRTGNTQPYEKSFYEPKMPGFLGLPQPKPLAGEGVPPGGLFGELAEPGGPAAQDADSSEMEDLDSDSEDSLEAIAQELKAAGTLADAPKPIVGDEVSLVVPIKKFKDISIVSRYEDLLFFIIEHPPSDSNYTNFVVDLRSLYQNIQPRLRKVFDLNLQKERGATLGHMKILFGKVFLTQFSKNDGVALNIFQLDKEFVCSEAPQKISLKDLTVGKAPAQLQIFDFSKSYFLKLMSMEMFSKGGLIISGRSRAHDNSQFFGYFVWKDRRRELEFMDIKEVPYADILSEMNHPKITYIEKRGVPFFMMYWSSTYYKLGTCWRGKITILGKKCKILNCPTHLPYNGGLQRDPISVQPVTNKFLVSLTTGRYSLPETVVSVFQIEINF